MAAVRNGSDANSAVRAEGKEERILQEKQALMSYIKDHSVEEAVQDVLQKLMAAKPDDPRAWLLEALDKELTAENEALSELELHKLFAVTKKITSEIVPQDTIDMVIQETLNLVHCDTVSLFVLDKKSGMLRLHASNLSNPIMVPQSLGSRMFPALVSPRHMGPSRGESSLVEHKSSPSRSPSPPKERKEGPASKSVEFERKASKDPPMMTPWLSGKFDGTEPVFNRLPSLHEGAYDAEHGQRLEEYHKSKRRWIAGPIRPSGAHDAKRALDTSRLEIDNHIMDARTRGKVGNELLKQRYDTRRAAFKKEHDKEKSSFESRYDESPGSPAPSSPGFSPRLSRAATTRLFGNQVNPALAIENSRPVADPAILGLFKSAFKAGGTDMAW